MSKAKDVADYRHQQATRLNNPTAALAREDVEAVPKRRYAFDPHLSPELQWAGKTEEPELEVDAPSIHVHERLSTEAIVHAARSEPAQIALFGDPQMDRAQQVEFYKHPMDWANRLILGDSLVGMTSLLERERMAGRVDMVYLDPPYGINFNSNFQARLSDRSAREGDSAIPREPEQIQAYRDTWKLEVHTYLTYLRQRLTVAHDLLAPTGSIFVQIGPDNVHRVRLLLDEVFGAENAVTTITTMKTAGATGRMLPEVYDFILWFAKDRDHAKYRQLYADRSSVFEDSYNYRYVELAGSPAARRTMTAAERSG